MNVSRAQWTTDPLIETNIQQGIKHVYNLSFDSAKARFNEIVRLQPKEPIGYFFLASVEWWRIAIDIDNNSYDDRFYSLLDKVTELCDERLATNEHDLPALFFKGGALGFRARLHAIRSDWIKAASAGRDAFNIVQETHRLAPENYDILLGIGIYNYYAEVIPDQYPMVKPLMIFFPKGDKKKGLDQLRTASLHARYANTEAAYFLLQILVNYEKRFDEGLSIAAELNKQYPDNVIFHKYLGRCFIGLNRMEDAQNLYRDILHRVNNHRTGYNKSAEREAEFYLGIGDMSSHAYESALKHFLRCDELSRTLEAKEQSGFMVLTNLKMGMIYDALSQRDNAIKQYNKVLAMSDYQDAHEQARRYLKTPYGKS